MERKRLFEILYPQYAIERTRYDNLHSRAQESLKVTGVITAIFGFFVGNELLNSAGTIGENLLYVIGLAALVVSVLFTIMASVTKPYREIVDIKSLVLEAEERSYEEEDIYSVMLANMADCSSHNNALTDGGFGWLSRSRFAMAVGIILVTAGVLVNAGG